MNDQPSELFARIDAEFARVGIGPDAVNEAGRRLMRLPDGSPISTDGINGDIGFFRLVLSVLQSLPDHAGRGPFIDALVAGFAGQRRPDAGA